MLPLARSSHKEPCASPAWMGRDFVPSGGTAHLRTASPGLCVPRCPPPPAGASCALKAPLIPTGAVRQQRHLLRVFAVRSLLILINTKKILSQKQPISKWQDENQVHIPSEIFKRCGRTRASHSNHPYPRPPARVLVFTRFRGRFSHKY